MNNTMRPRVFTGYLRRVVAVTTLLLPAGLFAASVTYTYTGNPFTNSSPNGNITTADLVTVNFTLAGPLAASQSDLVLSPTTWSLADGIPADKITNSSTLAFGFPEFEVKTDASGNIIGWSVAVCTTGFSTCISTSTPGTWLSGTITAATQGDSALDPASNGAAFNSGVPGKWVAVTQTSGVPEPSTAGPLALLIPSAWLMLRRRK